MKKAAFILCVFILTVFLITCTNGSDKIDGTWIICNDGSAFCTITKQGKVFNLHVNRNSSDWVLEKKSDEIFTGANGMITVRYDEKSNHLFVSAIGEKNKELCSTKDIIGTPKKLNRIEVAEHDFPNLMNWDEAQAACENLGNGWRLPTREELNDLYLNRDKFGGFKEAFWWSSTEDLNKTAAWGQVLIYPDQMLNVKQNKIYVRAVRTF